MLNIVPAIAKKACRNFVMKTIHKLLLVLTVVVATTCSYIGVDQPANQTRLSCAVAQIINDFYRREGSSFHIIKSVHVSSLYLFNDILTGVLRNIVYTELATEIEDYATLKMMKDRKRFSVIIFVDSIKSFDRFFSKLTYDKFKLRRYFTIVVIKLLEKYELEMILDSFWSLFVKNVNIVMNSDTGGVDLFTFVPFNDRKCGDTKPVKINSFHDDQMKWRNRKFHPEKTRNLHKCPLIIGAGVGSSEPFIMVKNDSEGYEELYGIDKVIFDELSLKFNFKPKYEMHGNYPGSVFPNGTAVGEFKHC